MSKIKIQTVTFCPEPDQKKNRDRFLNYIGKAAADNVNLLVFPEVSLPGVHPDLSMFGTAPAAKKHFEDNAELIPEGESVQILSAEAKKYNMYIAWSMVEKDPIYEDRFYNTAVLVGPEGFVGSYRKVHQAGTERQTLTPGWRYGKVFDTQLGKVGMVICFDKVFPDTVRALKLQGADLVIAPTAWPGIDKRLGEADLLMQLHRYSGRTRAVENGVVFVDANLSSSPDTRFGAEGGHSRIVTPDGKILAETGWNEEAVTAEVDVQEEIARYYQKLGISKEEHIARLRKKQKKAIEIQQKRDVFQTTLQFGGDTFRNTLQDLPVALFYKWKEK